MVVLHNLSRFEDIVYHEIFLMSALAIADVTLAPFNAAGFRFDATTDEMFHKHLS